MELFLPYQTETVFICTLTAHWKVTFVDKVYIDLV